MSAVETSRPVPAGPRAAWLRREWSPGALGELLERVRDPSWSRRPWCGVTLTAPVDLDAADPATAGFLGLLIEAISHGVPVGWELGRVEGIDPRQFVHLPPPVSSAGGTHDDVVGAWRASHAYGLLYYRVGPGFVTLKDTRHEGAHARYTVVDPRQVEDFATLVDFVTSVRQDVPAAAGGELAATLLEENLAVDVGGMPVPLPFRMRVWPVPYVAV